MLPKTDNRLLLVLFITLLVKLAIAWFLPMTGDEAYFIVWGKHPDFGYYDHPPMVGWFLAAMLQVSDAAVWLRLPQILTTSFIGWAIYRLLRRQHEAVAVMAAVLYLLAPINVLGVLITTDTPLLLFSFLSAVCFYFAQRHDNFGWYLLSGLLLGLAFFSKFFAGLLGIAYFLYLLLFVRRGLRPWLGLLWVVAGTLPFIGLNLYWNYTHCWDNYLFNLLNRTSGNHLSLDNTLKYLVLLIYLVTPPILYYLLRRYRDFWRLLHSDRFSVFMSLFLIPYGLFLLLSLWVSIGLHWLLSFYPFVFLAIAPVFSSQQLRRSFWFMLPFSVLHVIFFAALVALSPGIFKSNENNYKDVVYGMHAGEIVRRIKVYQPDYLLATDSYTESALLSYAARQPIMVFGEGSHHARQDDMLTDFRRLDGKNILIVSYTPKDKAFAPYFREVEVKPLPVAETQYYLLLGKGFDYARYRAEVIEKILQRYYRIPDFLPLGQCYMHDKYGRPEGQGRVTRDE
jgi:4-amino-4-deoxy-L-arabinose transferase-like glycosyltransferase